MRPNQNLESKLSKAKELIDTFLNGKISIDNEYKGYVSSLLNGKLSIDNEYKGYVSSLGISILQSGLLPSIAFYMEVDRASGSTNKFVVDTNTKASRKRILEWIYNLSSYQSDFETSDEYKKKYKNEELSKKLFGLCCQNQNVDLFQKDILDSINALKLVLKMYPTTEPAKAQTESKKDS